MHALVEDFLFHVRHEGGQSGNTQRTYSAALNRFVRWAETQSIARWRDVELSHLTVYLQHERDRRLGDALQRGQHLRQGVAVHLMFLL